jgi:hypothetical protein
MAWAANDGLRCLAQQGEGGSFHWHPLLQFFKPFQDDVDLLRAHSRGSCGLGLLHHQESLTVRA